MGKSSDSQPVRKRPRKFFVHIDRPADVEKSRLELPVCMHEQEIIEAIHKHDTILISAATGTGKTTQVPQFLVEDGFGDKTSPLFKGRVAVTQPRRVAAVSCAERVAYEMGCKLGGVVGYHIRHKRRFGDETKVKFVTDGVLLREVEEDILLRKYSAVIIDEVHERSLNTDLLLSFLSRSVKMRKEKEILLGRLKIIIMSATLQIEGVFSGDSALFPNPPILKIPSRQYPVTVHFSKRTSADYLEEAFQKVCKIHRRLPPGGVLVFLSGRQEVDDLCSRVREEFGDSTVDVPDCEFPLGLKIFPFYALLPDRRQRQVFAKVNEKFRKIVVATNIAETSVTVPDISYVVDSGRVKEKVYRGDSRGLLTSYEVRWVSQAAAEQRTGRAARTGPGHCYRLYSSAVYDQQFEAFKQPEILTVPADAVVLRLRAMGILHVDQFPFPTIPNKERIRTAERLLTNLGALAGANKMPSLRMHTGLAGGRSALLGVTHIGRELATLPVPPRFGKILLAAHSLDGVLPYACRLAGILTVGTVLDKSDPNLREKQRSIRHADSDLLTELSAVCAVEHAGRTGIAVEDSASGRLNVKEMRELCSHLGLHLKSILEVLSISDQLYRMFFGRQCTIQPLAPPGKVVEEGIMRSFLSGFPDQIARRMTRHEAAALGVIPRQQKVAFVVSNREEPVFLESSSSLQLTMDAEFVCFSDLVRAERKKKSERGAEEKDDYEESDEDSEEEEEKEEDEDESDGRDREEIAEDTAKGGATISKLLLRGATVVKRLWIIEEATSMCRFSLPSIATTSEPTYSTTHQSVCEQVLCRYGNHQWSLGNIGLPIPMIGQLIKQTSKTDTRSAAQAMVFAKAILEGRVSAQLGLPTVTEKCVRVVAHSLREKGVLCVDELRRVSQDQGDFLGKVMKACGWEGWQKRLDEVMKQWKVEEFGIGVTLDDGKEDDENGYE